MSHLADDLRSGCGDHQVGGQHVPDEAVLGYLALDPMVRKVRDVHAVESSLQPALSGGLEDGSDDRGGGPAEIGEEMGSFRLPHPSLIRGRRDRTNEDLSLPTRAGRTPSRRSRGRGEVGTSSTRSRRGASSIRWNRGTWSRRRQTLAKCWLSNEMMGMLSIRATACRVGSKSAMQASGWNRSTSGRMRRA